MESQSLLCMVNSCFERRIRILFTMAILVGFAAGVVVTIVIERVLS